MSDGLSNRRALGGMSLGHIKGKMVADYFGHRQVPFWLDVRVFYVRVASCPLRDAPNTLTMCYPPRDISTAVELNGGRISPSEELKLTLRRDRLDKESSEATYVSTDNFRASGTVFFEIYDGENALLCGKLERLNSSTDAQTIENGSSDSARSKPTTAVPWKMDLTCSITSPTCNFFRGRQEFSSAVLSAPTMEVCVVGRHSELPVILTETVQLTVRRKIIRRNTLDAIVETDEGERVSTDIVLAEQPEQIPAEESGSYSDLTEKALARLGNFYGTDGTMNGYVEGDDGEISWFNASVRVGVGIGLGMCLGVGIGVGLLVRTYQATTRTFRRNIF